MSDETTAREALRAWISAPPADVARAPFFKMLPPGVVGGLVVQALAARARTRAGARDPIPGHVVEALLVDGRPELMLALGFLAHWPRRRFSHPRYPAAFVAAHPGPADWRALLLQRIGGALGSSFRLAGATARGAGDDAAYLRAALLERAMCREIAWTPEVWSAQIAPHQGQPVFWLRRQPNGDTTVLYGDREFPLPPREPGDEPASVRVLHPAELAPERRAALATLVAPDAEPFEQLHRAVYTPSAEELRTRMITRYRERTIEETVLFGHLRRRGWRRGEILDYPAFFELHLSDPECAWRPYIRVAPGIYSGGPESSPDRPHRQRIHAVSFQRRETPGPRWGGYLRTTDPRLGASFDDEYRRSRYETPEQIYGERIADVSPAVFSETIRVLEQVHARGARPA